MRSLAACVLFSLVAPAGAQKAPPSAAPRAEPPRKLWTEGGHGRLPADLPVTMRAFANLVRSIGPAVVNIQTLQVPDPASAPTSRVRGQGTGFVIEKSGYILTNHHVVENAELIKVRLADEREFSARLVGRDDRTDLAVIKIDAPGALPVAPLGDSDRVEIGEWVVAIGNPFGLDHTVTAGIVSAKERRDVRPGGATTGYYDFIQTDASINAGNSGGPLINTRGEVIGINTAMNAQAQGIAFAIPVNMAKAIVPLLVDKGHAPRSWLGLYPQSVTPSLRRAFALADMRGALVSEVVESGPAALAGIQAGDVIVEFDGHPIRRADDLQWLVAMAPAGRSLPIAIVRGGKARRLAATLLPAAPGDLEPPVEAPAPKRASPFGMTVSEITEGIAREIKAPDRKGVVVMAVEPESPAADAGVERGDVLLRVEDKPIESLEDYGKAVRAVPKGEMIKLLARRDGRHLWLAFQKR